MKEKTFNSSVSMSCNSIFPEHSPALHLSGSHAAALTESEMPPSLMTLTWLTDGSVKHFEPVFEDEALTAPNPKPPETEKRSEIEVNLGHKTDKSNFSANFSGINDSFFLIEDALNDERRLFIVLLFYLEKFTCLEAIEKAIREMESAVQTRNIDKLKQAVKNCRNECVNGEISDALPALFLLERINQYSELSIVVSLIRQLKTAHKNFKSRLTEKLNEINEKRQRILQSDDREN